MHPDSLPFLALAFNERATSRGKCQVVLPDPTPPWDGVGDDCDDTFCYVVDLLDACLDPTTAFLVYAGDDRSVRIDELVPLIIWANRENKEMEYEWSVVSRPAGSQATIENPRGTASRSTSYQYHYDTAAPLLTPDVPGEYEIKITSQLTQDDDLYPGKRISSAEFRLTAQD